MKDNKFTNRHAISAGYGQYRDYITSKRNPIIVLNGVMPLSRLRDKYSTGGDAIINDNPSEYQMSASTNNTNSAELVSSERGRYIPGNVMEVGVGVRLESNSVGEGQSIIWGYFNNEGADVPISGVTEGLFFGLDEGGFFVEVRKGGETKHKAYNDQFNETRDKIDLTKGGIFQDIQNTDINETSIEYDESATSVDRSTGMRLNQFFIQSGGGGNRSSIRSANDLPLSIPNQSVITICARSLGNEASVNTIIRVEEEF